MGRRQDINADIEYGQSLLRRQHDNLNKTIERTGIKAIMEERRCPNVQLKNVLDKM